MDFQEIGTTISGLIGTIAVMCVVCFAVENSKSSDKLNDDKNGLKKAIFIGVLAGLYGIYGTLSGRTLQNGAVISVRDIGPMFAGCFGGPIAGAIAGVIAGVHRLIYGLPDVTAGTTIPCSISTVLIGVICGFISKPFKRAKYKSLIAIVIGCAMEVMHLSLAFFYKWIFVDLASGVDVIEKVALPFILCNSLGFGLLTLTLRKVAKYKTTEAHEKEVSTELDVAKNIQKDMLPAIFPNFPGREEFDLFASMIPAKEVGGDFYDFFFIDDDHFAFLIGDVSGKGIPAALFMVISKTILKSNAESGLSAGAVLEKANKKLCEGNDEGMFVTVWLGIYEISTGKLNYASAGHNPPLIKRGDKDFIYLKDVSGFILAGYKDMKYKEFNTYLHDGDKLLLYTDGVTEAMDMENNQYGEKKLKDLVISSSEKVEPHEMIDIINKDVDDFRGKAIQSDDITMLAIRVSGKYDYLTLDAKLDNFDEFADFMNKKLKDKGISPSFINKMNIVLDELYSNVVNYSKSEKCTLGVSMHQNHISLILKYKGVLFDVTKTKEPDTSLKVDERQIGGLGLMIVKNSVDSIHYNTENNDTNVITLYKNF